MIREKIIFIINRLTKANLPELLYRIKQLYLVYKLKKLVKQNILPVKLNELDAHDIEKLKLPFIDCKNKKYRENDILKGKVFNLNTDIENIKRTEKEYQYTFYSDIKFSENSLDIRSLWEPSRLQHLVIVLSNILNSEETFTKQEQIQFVKHSTLEWIKNNPFLFGPHYISVMECGLRIPVFFYILKTIKILDSKEYKTIIKTIYLHGWLINKRLSLYSSLGNHTIAECVGLIFAGAIFRNTKSGSDWMRVGYKLLKKEIAHQILEDGGPAEHSFNYHRFVVDLYWLAVNFIEVNNLYDPSHIKERLSIADIFIDTLTISPGIMPNIGDSDDGFAIAPGIFPKRTKSNSDTKEFKTFETSGYTIINRNNIVLTFDHAHLGMPPLYNHGHADALSITLFVNNNEMIVDPGTYRYNGTPEFRKYFKSTRAHNTVTIDGVDQAIQKTGFIWSRPFKSNLIQRINQNGNIFLKAYHDGYMRLKNPVKHYRSIFLINKDTISIKDTFIGRGIHTFELNYHLHPDANITLEKDRWFKIWRTNNVIYVKLLKNDQINIIKGNTKPIFGWYSPSYGVKQKSSVLTCKRRGTAQEISFNTIICISSPENLLMNV